MIRVLEKTRPRWAGFLAASRWVWQKDTRCLKLFLPSPQARQELQNSSSLLLRFFQESDSALASILKLSIQDGTTDAQEAVPVPLPKAEGAIEAAQQTEAAPAFQNTFGTFGASGPSPPSRSSVVAPVVASASDPVLEPSDYAKLPHELPHEIQILQKVLRAQVRVREQKITDNDDTE